VEKVPHVETNSGAGQGVAEGAGIDGTYHVVVEVLGAEVDVGGKHLGPVIVGGTERGGKSGDGGLGHVGPRLH